MGQINLKKMLWAAVFILLTLTACGLRDLTRDDVDEETPQVDEILNATLTALASEAATEEPKSPTLTQSPEATPTETSQPSPGSISGELGYPSEYIPPLRVVAFDVNSQDYYFVDTQRNQSEYQIDGLPPGTYHVVAYVREEGPDIPGAYTHFVTCGQTTDCTDHSLIDVKVNAGQVREDVDPIDFYARPDEVNWPENPTQ